MVWRQHVFCIPCNTESSCRDYALQRLELRSGFNTIYRTKPLTSNDSSLSLFSRLKVDESPNFVLNVASVLIIKLNTLGRNEGDVFLLCGFDSFPIDRMINADRPLGAGHAGLDAVFLTVRPIVERRLIIAVLGLVLDAALDMCPGYAGRFERGRVLGLNGRHL